MLKLGGRKGKLLLAGFVVALFAIFAGSIVTSAQVAHAQAADAAPAADANKDTGDEKVCTTGEGLSGGLAYFLCPFTEIIAKSTKFFEEYIIVPFMTVSPLTTNANNPVYILWQNFRDLANIGFILMMFVSIFSVALSKHGAKRVLSRGFAVALGVNLSYFGVAFVIDAFNIFGAGISQLVISALQQAKTTQLNSGTDSGTLQNIFVLGGTALVTIVATGGAALGWLFSFMMLAILVVVIVVMILLLRQIAIIMLVILSPIAILLYMLPNTENYFQKWRKTLIQLLLMYPMIVMLFAAGKIFGVILQQPGLIKTGGDVTEGVAEAIRVILQFIVYVIPLAFLPATFAASGALMGRAYGWASGRMIQPRGKRLREDVGLGASELRARVARSKVPGVSWAAGGKYRRDYTRESRRRNVQRAQDEYTAGKLGAEGMSGSLMRRQASGVGGKAGQTRAAAYAASVLEKARQEDVQAESALLAEQFRRLGTNAKEFDKQFSEYLKGGSGAGGNGIITGTATDSNGRKIELDLGKNKNLVRAALNSAASQGEVGTIEAARMSTNLSKREDQAMVDSVIRANEGKMKEKGGYHLATNFNLAAGRGFDVSTDAGKSAAKVEMIQKRAEVIAQSGANSVAGMKAGVLANTAQIINTATRPLNIPAGASADEARRIRQEYNDAVAVYNGLSEDTRQAIYDNVKAIATNPNTLARTEGPAHIRSMYNDLQSRVPNP